MHSHRGLTLLLGLSTCLPALGWNFTGTATGYHSGSGAEFFGVHIWVQNQSTAVWYDTGATIDMRTYSAPWTYGPAGFNQCCWDSTWGSGLDGSAKGQLRRPAGAGYSEVLGNEVSIAGGSFTGLTIDFEETTTYCLRLTVKNFNQSIVTMYAIPIVNDPNFPNQTSLRSPVLQPGESYSFPEVCYENQADFKLWEWCPSYDSETGETTYGFTCDSTYQFTPNWSTGPGAGETQAGVAHSMNTGTNTALNYQVQTNIATEGTLKTVGETLHRDLQEGTELARRAAEDAKTAAASIATKLDTLHSDNTAAGTKLDTLHSDNTTAAGKLDGLGTKLDGLGTNLLTANHHLQDLDLIASSLADISESVESNRVAGTDKDWTNGLPSQTEMEEGATAAAATTKGKFEAGQGSVEAWGAGTSPQSFDGSGWTFHVGGALGQTIDCNPLNYDWVAEVANWFRTAVTWVFTALFFLSIVHSVTKTMHSAAAVPQSRSAGTAVMGTNLNSALALAMAAAIVVLLATIPALLFVWMDAGIFSYLVNSPFISYGGVMGNALALANAFLPLDIIVEQTVFRMVVQMTLGGVFFAVSAGIRFLVG
jgi:hypothetical protein